MLIKISISLTLVNLSLIKLGLDDKIKNNRVKLVNTFLDVKKVGVAKEALLDKSKINW